MTDIDCQKSDIVENRQSTGTQRGETNRDRESKIFRVVSI